MNYALRENGIFIAAISGFMLLCAGVFTALLALMRWIATVNITYSGPDLFLSVLGVICLIGLNMAVLGSVDDVEEERQ